MIKAGAPWFFEMRSLISERPNLVPMGVGNGSSAIDSELLVAPSKEATPSDDEGGDHDHGSIKSLNWDLERDEGDSDKEVVADNKAGVKRKREPGETDSDVFVDTKKTKPHAGKSKLTVATPVRPSSTKPKNMVERFAEVAKIEEETVQRQLELKKFRLKGSSDVAMAGIKAKAHTKVERDKRKAELMLQKSRQDHKYRMAELQARTQANPSHYAPNPSHGRGSHPWLTGPGGSTSTFTGLFNQHNPSNITSTTSESLTTPGDFASDFGEFSSGRM